MNNADDFAKKAKAYLDESVDELSPDITRRLQQARYAALEKAEKKSFTRLSFFPQTATAAFAIAVVSVSLFIHFNTNETLGSEIAMETDMEMLTSSDSLELMEELEFMQWLLESEEYAS